MPGPGVVPGRASRPPPLALACCLMAPESLGCPEAWQGLRSRLQRAEKVKPAHLPFLFLLLEVALHSENGSSGLWPSAFHCEFCFECWETVVVWPVVVEVRSPCICRHFVVSGRVSPHCGAREFWGGLAWEVQMLAAPLASTHWMPAAHQRDCQNVPDVAMSPGGRHCAENRCPRGGSWCSQRALGHPPQDPSHRQEEPLTVPVHSCGAVGGLPGGLCRPLAPPLGSSCVVSWASVQPDRTTRNGRVLDRCSWCPGCSHLGGPRSGSGSAPPARRQCLWA